MSFRLFIYYCALCGAWAAFVGWGLGRLAPITEEEHPYILQGFKGFLLGLTVALGLGLVDALWNVGAGRSITIALRATTAVLIASLSGLATGMVGEYCRRNTQPVVAGGFHVISWTLTGLLIGAALGAFETGVSATTGKNLRGALKKTLNGAIGGSVGGFLGGVLSLALKVAWLKVFTASQTEPLSPSAWGFVILGLCIGLLIGLAQVILRDASIKVEAGFRAGRELMLTKDETTIGRAETCDLGLFGDNQIEKVHARINRVGDRFVLVDADTNAGTYVNNERVSRPTPLRAGDAILVGKSLLRFGERQKRNV